MRYAAQHDAAPSGSTPIPFRTKLLFPLYRIPVGGVFFRVLLDETNFGSLFELPEGLHSETTLPNGGEDDQPTVAERRKKRTASALGNKGWIAWVGQIIDEVIGISTLLFLSGDTCFKAMKTCVGSVAAVALLIAGSVVAVKNKLL